MLLALAVAGGIAGTFPAVATAAPVQTLTVQTVGLPTGSTVDLYEVDIYGGTIDSRSWEDDATTAADGRVAFELVPGRYYTLYADATATTVEAYLGGASRVDDAAYFRAPVDGTSLSQTFSVPAAVTLTVQTSGLAPDSWIDLYSLRLVGGSIDDYFYEHAARIDATGRATFLVGAGRSYTVGIDSNSGTFAQFLGGTSSIDDAQVVTVPAVGSPAPVTFTPRASATLQGSVSVPPGVIPEYVGVRAYVWDEFLAEWNYVGSDSVGVGGYAFKVEPGRTYTVRAYGERKDGVRFVGKFVGGTTSFATAQRLAVTEAQSVSVPSIALDEVYLTHNVTVTGLPADGFARVALRSLGDDDESVSSVSTSQPTATFSDLIAGKYLVTVTSATGVASQFVDITAAGATTAVAPVPATGVIYADTKFSGASRVGATLTASTKIKRPATGATATTYWSIDGKVVATGDTFVVQASVLDAVVSAVTVVSAPGHMPVTQSWSTRITEKGDAPRASVAPRIVGVPQVGAASTVATGTWDVADASLAVQWTRDGAPITGATGTSYTPVAADVGKLLGVTVTASGTNRAESSVAVQAVAVVAPGAAVAYTAKVAGTPKIGSTLRASTVPAGWKASYQWFRGGKAISGAKKSSRKVIGADAGAKLSVRVTLTRAGYTTTVTTSAVTKAVPKAKASVKVTAGKKSATVKVTASGITAPTGKVTVTYGKKKVTVTLSAKHKGKISVKLPKGTHTVKVSYAGSSQVAKASTKTLRVKVR